MENFKVTIEAVSEEARKQMGGARVYDCDNVLLLAGKPVEAKKKGMLTTEMSIGIVGSMLMVGRMFVQFVDAMPDKMRMAVGAEILAKRTGRMVAGETVVERDEPYAADAEITQEQMDAMLAELLKASRQEDEHE